MPTNCPVRIGTSRVPLGFWSWPQSAKKTLAAPSLEASLAMISELGYDNLSIEAIARRAGVSKQTIYRWWPSKGAVILEAATDSIDAAVARPWKRSSASSSVRTPAAGSVTQNPSTEMARLSNAAPVSA